MTSYNQDVDNQAGGYRPDNESVATVGGGSNSQVDCAPSPAKPAPEAQALKACPFCGGNKTILTSPRNKEHKYHVICRTARCHGSAYSLSGGVAFPTKEDAINNWNTRASDPALTEALAVIEKQREALEFARDAMPPSITLQIIEQALALTDWRGDGEMVVR